MEEKTNMEKRNGVGEEIQVKHFQKNISHAIPPKEKEKENNAKVEGSMDK